MFVLTCNTFLYCRYFARLSLDFEVRMELYRQQIEEMESHLASLHQPSLITPQGTRLQAFSICTISISFEV